MDLEQHLRENLAAPDPGVQFTAAVMTRVHQTAGRQATGASVEPANRSRVHNRFILIGTLAALAAAAAVLVMLLSGTPQPSAIVASAGQPAPVVLPAAVPAETPPSAPATPTPLPHKDATPRYLVAVLPLRHESQNPAGRAPLEAFHAALLEGLRGVPGLTMVLQETVDPAAEQRADYLLTVASVAQTVLPSGQTMTRSTDGRSFAGSMLPSASMQVEIIVQPTRGQPKPADYNTMFSLAEPDSPAQRQICEQAPEQIRERMCLTMAMRVARQVEALRSYVFPPDPVWQQGMVARLRDVARSNSARADSLSVLLNMQKRGLHLDAAAIGTVVEYITALAPDRRAAAWRSLPLAGEAGFVPPLLDVLRQHPDAKVRLEALMALATNQDADPRVRAALASVALEDATPIMRMAAHRALSGDAEWNGYVVATLMNTDLPLAQRLEPLKVSTEWAPGDAAGGAPPLVNNKQVVTALLGMAREGLSAPGQVEATRQALELLKNADDPAVADLFLQIVQDKSPSQGAFITTAIQWMSGHENDPRVRKLLDEGLARSGIPPGFLTSPR